jgi:hypothetical protein
VRLSRHHRSLAAALVSVAALVPGIALAHYHAPCYMTGKEEVPANTSAAIAIGNIDIINGVTDSLRVNITFSGLSGNATAAHIHGPAPSGLNAGVMIPLTVPAVTSGTIAQRFAITAAQKADIIGSMTYANIHTGLFGGGEIRGQIDSLDQNGKYQTPGATANSLILLGLALAGFGAAVLVRRKVMA